jgi:molybdate transport system substrate-binding protein
MRAKLLWPLTLTAVLPALILNPGCAPPAGERPESDEIIVAAAANLTDAFDEMAKRFTSRTGIRVTNSFGATADLARQVENGAPFDVFAAADVRHVEELGRKGLLAEGSVAVYARGRLVLWVPGGSRTAINRVEDLAGSQITRIAVAKPDVAPYGEAAVEALRALGLWPQVEPKVVYAQNVAQAKQFAASGNADAAFIPRALVKADEGMAVEIDAGLHRPIDQAIGIVRTSKKQEQARRFLDFVLGDEGQAMLESYGYERGKGERVRGEG